jgi:hypothetical protein
VNEYLKGLSDEKLNEYLATSLENRGKDVNTWLYWDAGHGADEYPEDFIDWIGNVTGFSKQYGVSVRLSHIHTHSCSVFFPAIQGLSSLISQFLQPTSFDIAGIIINPG